MRVCKRSSNGACLALLAAAALVAACTPRVLDVVDLCGEAGTSPGCPAPPDPILRGLVGWWPLDDGTGSGVARDVSSNRNDGALSVDLDPATVWQPGRTGSGLEIAGLGYVVVPHTPSIDSIVDQVTMSAWIYFEGSVDPTDMWGTALSREIGTTNQQHYHISLSLMNMPSMFINNDLTSASTAAPRFKWVHLCGTYDGAFERLYVDGTQASAQPLTGPFAADTTPVILGGNGNGPGVGVSERFPGRIDELMLWNRALGPDEVARLAAGPLAR